MNEQAEKVQISLDDVMAAIRRQMIELWKRGQHWHYVRVYPDGSIVEGLEVSPCYPESEYFQRGNPWPVTVWSETGRNGPSGPDDGTFQLLPCEEAEAEFWVNENTGEWSRERDEAGGFIAPYLLSDDPAEEPDLSAERAEAVESLVSAGYEVV